MRPSICQFISDIFYDSRLTAHESTADRSLNLQGVDLPNEGIVMIPTEHEGCSQKSVKEGEIIKTKYGALLGQEFNNRDGSTRSITKDDILVVTPYNAQVNYLRSILPNNTKVGAVDKFQDQEAPIVIVEIMEFLTDYTLWASFLSLTALEIILGIDNVVFITLLVGHLPEKQREKARVIGLLLALAMRIAMLFGIVWIIGLKEPWIELFGNEFSGKDLLMLAGGLFLLYKATDSIHNEVSGDKKTELKEFKGGFTSTITQIVLIDLVFSFDSVMTAVGITEHIWGIVAAMTVAMIVMIVSSGVIARFIEAHPTLKMLALSFVIMIGVFLVAEGLGFHVPKGYIYFGMAFSLGAEALNMVVRKRRAK